ncbi:aldo/keto reductase [uncultured Schumannella sp.]|uniref:aldo/keto reductase n=1 Tax=uncultured Schumannella sp. TaxID=1195956 RepID=UPI0025E2EA50|nr:aldo/keto reductase [uncultured Schumannella sp.]
MKRHEQVGTVSLGPDSGSLEMPVLVGGVASVRRQIRNSELSVFPIALGGNVFGWTADATETERILDRYAQAGGNFIDTADSYAGGRSEIMIGNWMRFRRNRDDLVVATKVGKGPEHPGVTARAISAAVEDSLRRLRTDRIDLLYLHIDDPEVPFEQTLLAVDELIRAGKVRAFGGSDHAGNRLVEARIASAQLGVARMVAVQNHYNLMHRRQHEQEVVRVARELDLSVMPRFGLASGFLTGKYRTRADIARSDRRLELADYLTRTGLRVLAALDKVSSEVESTPAAVSLAWLLTKPHVAAPVVSASRAEHVDDFVAATKILLSRHQLLELDRASS